MDAENSKVTEASSMERLCRLVHELKEEDLNNYKQKIQAKKLAEQQQQQQSVDHGGPTEDCSFLSKILVPTTPVLITPVDNPTPTTSPTQTYVSVNLDEDEALASHDSIDSDDLICPPVASQSTVPAQFCEATVRPPILCFSQDLNDQHTFCGDEVTLFEPPALLDHEDQEQFIQPQPPEAAVSPPRPLSFSNWVQSIEKKLSKKQCKSSEDLASFSAKSLLKRLPKTIIKKAKVRPPPPTLPPVVVVPSSVVNDEDEECKLRSQDRAKQIKKARDEFLLGTPPDSLSLRGSSNVSENQQSLDGGGEETSHSCPSSPRLPSGQPHPKEGEPPSWISKTLFSRK